MGNLCSTPTVKEHSNILSPSAYGPGPVAAPLRTTAALAPITTLPAPGGTAQAPNHGLNGAYAYPGAPLPAALPKTVVGTMPMQAQPGSAPATAVRNAHAPGPSAAASVAAASTTTTSTSQSSVSAAREQENVNSNTEAMSTPKPGLGNMPGSPAVDHNAVSTSQTTLAAERAPPPAPGSPEMYPPPQPVQNFTLGKLIGQGAFGRVFQGLNTDTGQLIAVKQVALTKDEALKHRVSEHVRALEAEIAVLQQLRHPCIVQYLGTQRTTDTLNIFLEYVPGGSIASLIQRFGGTLPENVVRMYTYQILMGLEYLHKKKIMHRDIKGANLLVDSSGIVKLADFGASRKIEDLATVGSAGGKSINGTPCYMAPEIIKQTGHGRPADIWSLGCVIIEMATGKPPWSDCTTQVAAMFQIASSNRPPPLPKELSQEAKNFLLLCFNRTPKDRPTATRLLQHPWLAGIQNPFNSMNSMSSIGASRSIQLPYQRGHLVPPLRFTDSLNPPSPIKEEPEIASARTASTAYDTGVGPSSSAAPVTQALAPAPGSGHVNGVLPQAHSIPTAQSSAPTVSGVSQGSGALTSAGNSTPVAGSVGGVSTSVQRNSIRQPPGLHMPLMIGPLEQGRRAMRAQAAASMAVPNTQAMTNPLPRPASARRSMAEPSRTGNSSASQTPSQPSSAAPTPVATTPEKSATITGIHIEASPVHASNAAAAPSSTEHTNSESGMTSGQHQTHAEQAQTETSPAAAPVTASTPTSAAQLGLDVIALQAAADRSQPPREPVMSPAAQPAVPMSMMTMMTMNYNPMQEPTIMTREGGFFSMLSAQMAAQDQQQDMMAIEEDGADDADDADDNPATTSSDGLHQASATPPAECDMISPKPVVRSSRRGLSSNAGPVTSVSMTGPSVPSRDSAYAKLQNSNAKASAALTAVGTENDGHDAKKQKGDVDRESVNDWQIQAPAQQEHIDPTPDALGVDDEADWCQTMAVRGSMAAAWGSMLPSMSSVPESDDMSAGQDRASPSGSTPPLTAAPSIVSHASAGGGNALTGTTTNMGAATAAAVLTASRAVGDRSGGGAAPSKVARWEQELEQELAAARKALIDSRNHA